MYGELVPVGGGDPIPLIKKRLRVGRREGCDIVLNFGNVSGNHCLLEIEEGYWFVRDLESRNGIKIDGKRIMAGLRRRVDPDVELTIAKHVFKVHYDPNKLGAYGTPPQDEIMDDFFRESLLDRAGLKRRDKDKE
jgi:adenylate cyclase